MGFVGPVKKSGSGGSTTQTTTPTGFAAMDPTVQLGVLEGATSGLGGILQYAMQAREAKKNL